MLTESKNQGVDMIMLKRYFYEFTEHLLEGDKPSAYFRKIEDQDFFNNEYPFTLLSRLKNTEQNLKWHPEGNVWNHTLNVIDNGALLKEKSDDPLVFMWSCLLHDIGKPETTKLTKGRITAYDHDKAGERLAAEFLNFFGCDGYFVYKVSKMVRWHMQVLMVIKNLPQADLETMVKEVPVHEIALLAMCDRLGRGEVTREVLEEERKNIKYFLEKCMPLLNS
ncbi:hypothetical protein Cst_c21970 [Thermoclostridium stercorarium subsp. stercorarium DSM 8532]|jgi:tRNA nucleotidyltransferase (CCA-adding enzyme)|uniref:HD domain-containing protein n=2 Tax=Thermoclostridium stercorarium TaxID=1510 RepID=L7VR79_THES1|nr:hypothetical protein Cst_c21970 [Thermoclostridium stercorarium subsp. stercorarium DSM 8532]